MIRERMLPESRNDVDTRIAADYAILCIEELNINLHNHFVNS